MIPVWLFENHDEAYHIWSGAGIRDASIVHLDAHHDLTWLDDPGQLCIGNYLCQAIKDGIAGEIYWVVPDGALSTRRTRRAIVGQLRSLRSAYPRPKAPLARASRRLATALLGARLIVCEWDGLPLLDRPLLDVDTDFLVTSPAAARPGRPAGEPWLAPRELVSRLREVARGARAVTIAYSVEGGYTPLQWKYLGDELAVRFGDAASAQDLRGFEQMALAHACARRGQIAEAERAFGDAAQELANPAAARFGLARLLLQSGRPEMARAAYRSAIASDPSYATAYNCSGRADIDLGRFDEAARAFGEMLALDAADRYAHFGLASIARRRGRWTDVEQHTRAALACGLAAPDAHRLLAEALERQGRRADAVVVLQDSLRSSLRGDAPVGGRIASRRLASCAAPDPGLVRAFASLGQLEADLGQEQSAIASLRLAIAGGYHRPGVHARLARLYAARRRWRDALAEAARAVAVLWARARSFKEIS